MPPALADAFHAAMEGLAALPPPPVASAGLDVGLDLLALAWLPIAQAALFARDEVQQDLSKDLATARTV